MVAKKHVYCLLILLGIAIGRSLGQASSSAELPRQPLDVLINTPGWNPSQVENSAATDNGNSPADHLPRQTAWSILDKGGKIDGEASPAGENPSQNIESTCRHIGTFNTCLAHAIVFLAFLTFKATEYSIKGAMNFIDLTGMFDIKLEIPSAAHFPQNSEELMITEEGFVDVDFELWLASLRFWKFIKANTEDPKIMMAFSKPKEISLTRKGDIVKVGGLRSLVTATVNLIKLASEEIRMSKNDDLENKKYMEDLKQKDPRKVNLINKHIRELIAEAKEVYHDMVGHFPEMPPEVAEVFGSEVFHEVFQELLDKAGYVVEFNPDLTCVSESAVLRKVFGRLVDKADALQFHYIPKKTEEKLKSLRFDVDPILNYTEELVSTMEKKFRTKDVMPSKVLGLLTGFHPCRSTTRLQYYALFNFATGIELEIPAFMSAPFAAMIESMNEIMFNQHHPYRSCS